MERMKSRMNEGEKEMRFGLPLSIILKHGTNGELNSPRCHELPIVMKHQFDFSQDLVKN
jgi:hypothetical protein